MSFAPRDESGRGRLRCIRTSLRILYLLSESRGITWYRLAEESGVRTRTVRRHVRALQDAGFAIDVFNPQENGWTNGRAVLRLVNPQFAARVLKQRVAL